jgi:hypothetical protein
MQIPYYSSSHCQVPHLSNKEGQWKASEVIELNSQAKSPDTADSGNDDTTSKTPSYRSEPLPELKSKQPPEDQYDS